MAAFLRAGIGAGDVLRVAARTSGRTLPRSRRISAQEARLLAPGLRGDVRGAPALLGRPARGRRPAGRDDRPDRGPPRRRPAHPGPRGRAHRRPRRAPRRADRGDRRGVGPRGGERRRRLGRPPGRRRGAPAQPRHPPGAPGRHPAGPAGRAHPARARGPRPVRERPAAGRRAPLRRPHRRARRRRPARRTAAVGRRDRLPAGHCLDRPGPAPDACRRGRLLRRAAAAAARRRRDRRPLPQARRADLAVRRRHGRGRQAHHLPPDGGGHRRRGRTSDRDVRGPVPDDPPSSRRSRAPRPARAADGRPRPARGWSVATAPTPPACWTPPAP